MQSSGRKTCLTRSGITTAAHRQCAPTTTHGFMPRQAGLQGWTLGFMTNHGVRLIPSTTRKTARYASPSIMRTVWLYQNAREGQSGDLPEGDGGFKIRV